MLANKRLTTEVKFKCSQGSSAATANERNGHFVFVVQNSVYITDLIKVAHYNNTLKKARPNSAENFLFFER